MKKIMEIPLDCSSSSSVFSSLPILFMHCTFQASVSAPAFSIFSTRLRYGLVNQPTTMSAILSGFTFCNSQLFPKLQPYKVTFAHKKDLCIEGPVKRQSLARCNDADSFTPYIVSWMHCDAKQRIAYCNSK